MESTSIVSIVGRRLRMKLQSQFEVFGKWSCLALSYLYCAIKDVAEEEEINNEDYVNVALSAALITAYNDKSILDEECTVLNPVKLMEGVAGKKYTVTKKDISSLDELKTTPKACVRFNYNGQGHFVYCEYGKVVFNSLDRSYCVNYGRPTTARIIEAVE